MKKAAAGKLRSKRGETLAETLVSVLIMALAFVMLAGAISTAKEIIQSSDQIINEYYGNINNMGSMTASAEMKLITPTAESPYSDLEKIQVKHADNTAFKRKPVVAYCYDGSVTP